MSNYWKKVLAAVLYVVGAGCVLLIAYYYRVAPSSAGSYFPLIGLGMVLVAVAAVLWPKPEGSSEGREEPEGNDDNPQEGAA